MMLKCAIMVLAMLASTTFVNAQALTHELFTISFSSMKMLQGDFYKGSIFVDLKAHGHIDAVGITIRTPYLWRLPEAQKDIYWYDLSKDSIKASKIDFVVNDKLYDKGVETVSLRVSINANGKIINRIIWLD